MGLRKKHVSFKLEDNTYLYEDERIETNISFDLKKQGRVADLCNKLEVYWSNYLGDDIQTRECVIIKSRKQLMEIEKSRKSQGIEDDCSSHDVIQIVDHLKEDWLMNVTCGSHVCPFKSWFRSFNDESGKMEVNPLEIMEFMGIGSIMVEAHNGIIMELMNVKYVPKAKRCHLSLDALVGEGFSFIMEGEDVKVYMEDMECLVGSFGSLGCVFEAHTILEVSNFVDLIFCDDDEDIMDSIVVNARLAKIKLGVESTHGQGEERHCLEEYSAVELMKEDAAYYLLDFVTMEENCGMVLNGVFKRRERLHLIKFLKLISHVEYYFSALMGLSV